MHLSDNLNPDNVFKFVNIRQAQAVKPDDIPVIVGQVPYANIPKAAINAGESLNNLLYTKILVLKGADNALVSINACVKTYKTMPQYAVDEPALRATFPALNKLINYADGYGNALSKTRILDKFNSWANLSLDKYAGSDLFYNSQMILWDNLVAHLLFPEKNAPVSFLCKILGACNLINTISTSGAKELSSKALLDAYRLQPLIPEWLVKTLLSKPTVADATINTVNFTPADVKTGLYTRIALSATAVNELRNLQNGKIIAQTIRQESVSNELNKITDTQGLKFPEMQERIRTTLNSLNTSSIASSKITKNDITTFSKGTLTYLKTKYTEIENLDINLLVNNEVTLSGNLFSQLGMVYRDPIMNVAGTFLGPSDHGCQVYDSHPYCMDGKQNTKPFVSNGSFVNAMIIGDLLVTKQQLLKYDIGEAAHIENILMGEQKTRTYRSLDRTELTTTTVNQTETETEKDTQTTQRFNLEKETANVLSSQFNINTGVNTTFNYGTVASGSAYMNGGYSSSTQESNKLASNFSKEVSEKALDRVKTLVSTTQTVNVLKETEETNVHTLTNVGGNQHINGVYRWVDKFYLNKVINYGRRLMLEFMIPEPANFYIFRNIQQKNDDAIPKPKAPGEGFPGLNGRDGMPGLTGPDALDEFNYTFWSSYYGANDVGVPPASSISFSQTFKNVSPFSQSGDEYETANYDIKVDDGYEVSYVDLATVTPWWGSNGGLNIIISNTLCGLVNGGSARVYINSANAPLDRTTIGLSIYSHNMGYILNVRFTLNRTAQSYRAWKEKTYAAIIDAYQKQLDAYNEWLNNQYANSIVITGNNPDINRETEKTELKKRCLELFSGQRFEANDAAVDGIHNLSGYPEILFNEAIREGNITKFFEHAFEWENITYVFYDYFYGRKSKWLTLNKLDDQSDPLFKKFLQAGMARTVVPVRPGYEKLVMMFHVMSNWISSVGCGWNFDPQIFGQFNLSTEFSPGIENGTYMSIAAELKDAATLDDYGTFTTDPVTGDVTTNIIDAYIQKVPTNLVYLANIDANGLPVPSGNLPDNSSEPELMAVMTYFDLQ